MPLRILFRSLFFILISSRLCSSSLRPEEPLADFHGRTVPGTDLSDYPSFFGTIHEDRSDYLVSGFEGTNMDNRPETIDSTRGDQLGAPATAPGEVNVDDFGAKGDGETDDTKAFKKAWKEACSSNAGVLVVPEKKYHLRPIIFSGPCKSDIVMLKVINVVNELVEDDWIPKLDFIANSKSFHDSTYKILGNIFASNDRSDYKRDRRHWLMFANIMNFIVEGGEGTIDGNGEIWWKNSCKINTSQPCTVAPTAVTFYRCENLRVFGLNVKNAQQMHVRFEQSVNVEAHNVMLTAPEKSPNTDGIHVTASQNVHIISSVIRTGDDCISIVNGSKNVQAIDVNCGPGHGISIGSLGKENSEAFVENVMVNKAKLTGTTNGVRIKTWQGGSGYAKNVVFENIEMENVENPIIINQNYCDQDTPCKEQYSAVQVRDIAYKNIKGTSASDVAIKFDCSKNFPCRGILLQDIDLVPNEEHREANSTCVNVKELKTRGSVTPQCSCEDELE